MSLHSGEAVGALIKQRLETRTIAQGAETDLGATVYLGRRHVDDTMIPCTTLIEGPDEPGRGHVVDEYEVAQKYIVFAYVPCDANAPNTAAHAAIRDIKRALFRTAAGGPDKNLGGQVRALRYLGRDIGPRADGAAFVVVGVEVEATYVEKMSQQ
jgi:hypothetical protein